MKLGKIGAAAIREHDAAIAAVIRLAHGGVHADLGGDTAHEQRLDAAGAQDGVEVGLVERAFAGFIDHRLAVDRGELGHNVVPRLAADQDAAHGSRRADAQRRVAALDLERRRVGKVGAMALAGVDHEQPGPARRFEHCAAGPDRGGKPRHVIAQRGAEPARLQEDRAACR